MLIKLLLGVKGEGAVSTYDIKEVSFLFQQLQQISRMRNVSFNHGVIIFLAGITYLL